MRVSDYYTADGTLARLSGAPPRAPDSLLWAKARTLLAGGVVVGRRMAMLRCLKKTAPAQGASRGTDRGAVTLLTGMVGAKGCVQSYVRTAHPIHTNPWSATPRTVSFPLAVVRSVGRPGLLQRGSADWCTASVAVRIGFV